MAGMIRKLQTNREKLTSIEQRMHPLIVMLRRALLPEDRMLLDELYEAAEDNINLASKTVGLVTDLEMILFSLLMEQQKMLYLLEQKVGQED